MQNITFTTGRKPADATHGIDDGMQMHWTVSPHASRWQVAMAFLATAPEPSDCEIVVETLATECSDTFAVSNGNVVQLTEA